LHLRAGWQRSAPPARPCRISTGGCRDRAVHPWARERAAADELPLSDAFGVLFFVAVGIGAGLAQIGEFSFIVATTAVGAGLLPDRCFQLIVAAALLSIALNPVAYGVANRIDRRFASRAS
jgi:predicted Kef-type K+ transport protein